MAGPERLHEWDVLVFQKIDRAFRSTADSVDFAKWTKANKKILAFAGDGVVHGYVGVQSRGVVALPAEVRRRLHLDEPGAQVEITEREDGVLELRPALPVRADQRWFWTERWQEREHEVDAHIAAGEVTVHEDGQALLDHLAQLDEE